MAWVRLDDSFTDHPKVVGLSDAAFRLHVHALCYANRHLTNGFLSDAWLLGGQGRQMPKAIQALVTSRLWDRDDERRGYQIHDYLEYQSSRLEVETERHEKHAAKSRAGKIGGVASGIARRKQDGSTSEADVKQPASFLLQAHAKQNEAPSHPIPSQEDPITRSTTTSVVPAAHPSSSPLIVSPLRFEKARESFAFFGSRLRVPHVLHHEFTTKLGRFSDKLPDWYLSLNDSVATSGEPIPDVFEWLRPKFKTWAASLSGDAEMAKFLSGEV